MGVVSGLEGRSRVRKGLERIETLCLREVHRLNELRC